MIYWTNWILLLSCEGKFDKLDIIFRSSFIFILAEKRKVTIIGDSIIKNVSGIDGCLVQSFRGDTIAQLANKINNKKARLLPYDYVILHVGTNDIDNHAPFVNIMKDFANLIGIDRKIHPAIFIIVSAILPRPCDYKESDSKVRDVNSHLNKHMSKDLNFKFVCTYKPFTYCGKPKVELYAKNDGGLHLNTEGSNRLKHFFLQVITHL